MSITVSDLKSVQYFWTEKGELTRWTAWEEVLPELRREYPEIVAAWEGYLVAKKTLDAVIHYTLLKAEGE